MQVWVLGLLGLLACASSLADHPDSTAVSAEEGSEDAAAPDRSLYPILHEGDTREGTKDVSRYDCAPRSNQSGPEQVYELDLPEAGLVIASLVDVETGADVDVHILSGDECLERGDQRAVAFVEGGPVRVVADTWTDGAGRERSGAYTLSIQFVGLSDYAHSGLSKDVLGRGLKAWTAAWNQGDTTRTELTVVDFARRSDKERFFTIDLATGELVFALLTTHGEASSDPDDHRVAASFSNTPTSHQSSLGLMRVAEDYYGSFGHSMRMDGLEPHNSKVRRRFIVIHPHAWASREFAEKNGGTWPSYGCLMLDPLDMESVIDRLEGGTLVWNDFAGDKQMLASAYLAD